MFPTSKSVGVNQTDWKITSPIMHVIIPNLNSLKCINTPLPLFQVIKSEDIDLSTSAHTTFSDSPLDCAVKASSFDNFPTNFDSAHLGTFAFDYSTDSQHSKKSCGQQSVLEQLLHNSSSFASNSTASNKRSAQYARNTHFITQTDSKVLDHDTQACENNSNQLHQAIPHDLVSLICNSSAEKKAKKSKPWCDLLGAPIKEEPFSIICNDLSASTAFSSAIGNISNSPKLPPTPPSSDNESYHSGSLALGSPLSSSTLSGSYSLSPCSKTLPCNDKTALSQQITNTSKIRVSQSGSKKETIKWSIK